MSTTRVPDKVCIHPGNGSLVRVYGLYSLLDDKYFDTTATVKATLYNYLGQAVLGCIDIVLDYVTASNGNFQGQVDAGFNPPISSGYLLRVYGSMGNAPLDLRIDAEITLRTD